MTIDFFSISSARLLYCLCIGHRQMILHLVLPIIIIMCDSIRNCHPVILIEFIFIKWLIHNYFPIIYFLIEKLNDNILRLVGECIKNTLAYGRVQSKTILLDVITNNLILVSVSSNTKPYYTNFEIGKWLLSAQSFMNLVLMFVLHCFFVASFFHYRIQNAKCM